MSDSDGPADPDGAASTAGEVGAGGGAVGGRSVASVLFASKLRILGVVIVGLLALGGAAYALGVVGVPAVEGVENAIGPVNDSSTAIDTNVTVTNPNPVGVSLGGLSLNYSAKMNGITMATGQKQGLGLDSGESTLSFRTYLDNQRIPRWWVSHVRRGGTTTLTVEATATSSLLGQSATFTPAERTIAPDILSAFNSTTPRPIDANRRGVEDPILWINETGASWGSVTRETTPMRMRFVFYNPKTVAIPLTEIGYDVSMNDVDVGEGATEREYVIPPKSTRTVVASVDVQTDRIDDWWVSHLERNQRTRLLVNFSARVDPSNLGLSGLEAMSVPLRDADYEQTFETDIFGTKDASADDPDANETTSGDDRTATTDDGLLTDGSTTGTLGLPGDSGTTTSDGVTSGGIVETTADESTTTDSTDTTDSSGTTDSTQTTTADSATTTAGGDETTTDDGVLAVGPVRVPTRVLG